MNIEYIAGFFDGEGCISARVNNRGQALITVSLVQRDKLILKRIKEYFEYGSLRRMRGEFRNDNDNRLWNYQIMGAEQKLNFLQAIYPHLIVKREQTKLAIELVKRFIEVGNPRVLGLSIKEGGIRAEIVKQITELKKIKMEDE